MPSPQAIVEEVVQRQFEGNSASAENVKNNFSFLIENLQVEAYENYLLNEKRSANQIIVKYLQSKVPEGADRAKTISVAAAEFVTLDRFFLSLTQSRRARAGSTFESIIRILFKKLGYPFDEQQVINGKPDFILPSRVHFDHHPLDCIIFTAKRTLRERWRQIVTEGSGIQFFLATIDGGISAAQLGEMMKNKIHLVVPQSLIETKKSYKSAPNVISYEDFFLYHLDPAMDRWRAVDAI